MFQVYFGFSQVMEVEKRAASKKVFEAKVEKKGTKGKVFEAEAVG